MAPDTFLYDPETAWLYPRFMCGRRRRRVMLWFWGVRMRLFPAYCLRKVRLPDECRGGVEALSDG